MNSKIEFLWPRGPRRATEIQLLFPFKVNLIPNEEHINCPDFPAVVDLVLKMLIEVLKQNIRVKEFLRYLRAKHFLYDVIIFLLTKPNSSWYRKSEFFLLGGKLRQMPQCCAAQGEFSVLAIDF